jgi:hypothetical protein
MVRNTPSEHGAGGGPGPGSPNNPGLSRAQNKLRKYNDNPPQVIYWAKGLA